ncbi:Glutamate receptor 2.8 [Vitis vinifera]|uniref:Glutamate receptor 2.8 n=1 Tax=Vitis vinifera TaxID=29760 RepID=A0A438CUM6_VITVI|nr:Glutamate receptor 2.8 [Vitis vinifera]
MATTKAVKEAIWLKGITEELAIYRGDIGVGKVPTKDNPSGMLTNFAVTVPSSRLVFSSTHSTSKANLGTIVWPGEFPSIPKGCVLPTNKKKMRIGVPVTKVLDAVMAALPYAVPYEYIPFQTPDSDPAGFTLPYTESGVSIIVPIIDNRSKNAWVCLKPLTWDLWVTSAYFFVFIEERIVSNLTRFGVIIWFFVVLILTQSCTATLTSMLTVQQLKPTITDINEPIKNGECVDYQKGSFVYEFLKWMKFDETKLVIYESPEELDELFSNRSSDGGIAAAFEEIPYMKLFLAKYCSKYTAVQPTYKFDGFGFVFPKRSPLTPSCPELTSSVSSNSIDLNSFWGIILIAGFTSSVALIICIVSFFNENRDTLVHLDLPALVWRKIKAMATHFDHKDLSSHTFRKSGINGMDAVTTSPPTN